MPLLPFRAHLLVVERRGDDLLLCRGDHALDHDCSFVEVFDPANMTEEEYGELLAQEEEAWRESLCPGWRDRLALIEHERAQLDAEEEELRQAVMTEGERNGAVSLEPHIRLSMRLHGIDRDAAVARLMGLWEG